MWPGRDFSSPALTVCVLKVAATIKKRWGFVLGFCGGVCCFLGCFFFWLGHVWFLFCGEEGGDTEDAVFNLEQNERADSSELLLLIFHFLLRRIIFIARLLIIKSLFQIKPCMSVD